MGEAHERVRDADALELLDQDNAQRMAALDAVGITMDGLQPLVQQTLLNHVLVMLGCIWGKLVDEDPDAMGARVLRRAQLDLAGQVSNILDDAERNVDDLKRKATAARLGLNPEGLGLSTARKVGS